MNDFYDRIRKISSAYATDKIFLIGKGVSVDQVRPDVYEGSLVIAVNDAERIVPAGITLFYEDWVREGVKSCGYRSQLYITPFPDFAPEGREAVCTSYVPFTQGSSELAMQRLMGEGFYIEELLFLSALKLARLVADMRDRPQAVYLVGFDFDPAAGYSKAISRDYAPDRQEARSIKISMQEFYFINALHFLKESNISVRHVGRRVFSALTADDLNDEGGRGDRKSHAPHAVSVVAELTTNHFGDRSRLEYLIRASKAAGADFIKLQKRDVATFYDRQQLSSPYLSPFGKTFADYRFQLELDRDDFTFVDGLCRQIGIQWFASVLDKASFDFMMDLGVGMIKLPSTITVPGFTCLSRSSL